MCDQLCFRCDGSVLLVKRTRSPMCYLEARFTASLDMRRTGKFYVRYDDFRREV